MSHTPTLDERLRALGANPAEALPADVLRAFKADQAELDARGVPDAVARPGTEMPDADLLDVHGNPTSLTRLRDGKPAVAVFYRGGWCPYCNVTLRAYEAELVPALSGRGVELIALSPQKPDESLSLAEANHMTFTVASDPGNQLARELGILTESSPDALAAQLELGLDVTTVNADGGRTLPMPTVVVIDAAGLIRWIDVHPNYTTRTEVPDILAAVDAAVQSPGSSG